MKIRKRKPIEVNLSKLFDIYAMKFYDEDTPMERIHGLWQSVLKQKLFDATFGTIVFQRPKKEGWKPDALTDLEARRARRFLTSDSAGLLSLCSAAEFAEDIDFGAIIQSRNHLLPENYRFKGEA